MGRHSANKEKPLRRILGGFCLSFRVSLCSFKMTDIRSLEHPTLKVPYEILNKKFRTSQETLDREISQVQASVTQVEEYIKHCDGDVSGIPVLLETLEDRLKHLQEKSMESVNDEMNSSSSCKRRIHHLKIGCIPPTPASEAQWRKTR